MTKHLKISYGLIIGALLLSIIYSVYFQITGFEQHVLFMISLMAAVGFFVSVAYNLIMYIRQGHPEDIWKLGWLGFLGILGVINSGFFGFMGFFGFFGNRHKK